jgi:hypothetical protein
MVRFSRKRVVIENIFIARGHLVRVIDSLPNSQLWCQLWPDVSHIATLYEGAPILYYMPGPGPVLT